MKFLLKIEHNKTSEQSTQIVHVDDSIIIVWKDVLSLAFVCLSHHNGLFNCSKELVKDTPFESYDVKDGVLTYHIKTIEQLNDIYKYMKDSIETHSSKSKDYNFITDLYFPNDGLYDLTKHHNEFIHTLAVKMFNNSEPVISIDFRTLVNKEYKLVGIVGQDDFKGSKLVVPEKEVEIELYGYTNNGKKTKYEVIFKHSCVKNTRKKTILKAIEQNIPLIGVSFDNLNYHDYGIVSNGMYVEDLQSSIIRSNNFQNIEFANCCFKNSNIKNVQFNWIIVLNNDFSKSNISKCEFNNCHLNNTSFDNAFIKETVFHGSYYNVEERFGKDTEHSITNKGLTFKNTRLKNVIFKDFDLREVDFTGCSFENIVFDDCNLQGCNLDTELLDTCIFNKCKGKYNTNGINTYSSRDYIVDIQTVGKLVIVNGIVNFINYFNNTNSYRLVKDDFGYDEDIEQWFNDNNFKKVIKTIKEQEDKLEKKLDKYLKEHLK